MSSKRNWPTELVKRCEAVGWIAHKRKSHWRVVLPGGLGSLTIPATPSDARSYQNCLAEARRLGLERLEAARAEAAERERRARIADAQAVAEAACARAGAQRPEPETATGQEATTMTASRPLGTACGTPIAAVEPAYYDHPRAKAGAAPIRLKGGEHLLLEDGREVFRCAKGPEACRKTFASARALAGHMMQCSAAPKGAPEKAPSAPAQRPAAAPSTATLPDRLAALSGELGRLNGVVDHLFREARAAAEADEATRAKARRYDAMMRAAERATEAEGDAQ